MCLAEPLLPFCRSANGLWSSAAYTAKVRMKYIVITANLRNIESSSSVELRRSVPESSSIFQTSEEMWHDARNNVLPSALHA